MNLAEAFATTTAVCGIVGKLAKTWPKFPNAYIPTLVSALGAVIFPSLTSWTPGNVVAGFLAGASATGLHQAVRSAGQDIERRRTGNTEKIQRKDTL